MYPTKKLRRVETWVHPSFGDVKLRKRYFLRCGKCARDLADDDQDALLAAARSIGWKANYETDRVLCPDCFYELFCQAREEAANKYIINKLAKERR